ncbi:MAG: dethiobiotin synthase, partial [Deltaproteobacteria bacterium]
GVLVAGLKPFETGCEPTPRDAERLERAARSGLPLELRCPFRFRAPLAPAAAAEREGRDARGLVRAAARLARAVGRTHFIVVESAGGVMVPLEPGRTNLDLAAALGLPVLLVAQNALGTINHTALTLEALRLRRLRPWAVLLSAARRADPSAKDNARWIREVSGFERVVELPRSSRGAAAKRLLGELALDRLVR